MSVKLAQYGIGHDHARGKAQVLKESDQVDFCGVFEPSPDIRGECGANPAYEGVHWFSTKEEMLDDEAIVGIAVEGRVSENLTFARLALERGKHVWLDKPAGDNLDEFRSVLDIARDKGLLVQLGYMFRYNAGFQFVLDWQKRASSATSPPSERGFLQDHQTRKTGNSGIRAASARAESCSSSPAIWWTSSSPCSAVPTASRHF